MTFSIIARDRQTGAFGVATATGGPAVGSLVPHGAARAGALATQGYTNPFYGQDGLALLRQGVSARDIVKQMTEADPDRDRRQLIVIGAQGESAGWTGEALSPFAGMMTEGDFAIAGNLLAGNEVIEAMAAAFASAPGEPLEARLCAAMQAGQEAGGDRRGTLSAALRTYTDQVYPAIDIRIDHSLQPIADLAGLLEIVREGEYARFVASLPRR